MLDSSSEVRPTPAPPDASPAARAGEAKPLKLSKKYKNGQNEAVDS